MNRTLCSQLDDYLLGWLSVDEADAFERHLSACPACRRERQLQQTIDDMLAKTEGPLNAIPEGLIDRAKCHVQMARRRKTLRWVVSLTATAAVLLFAVFGHFMFRTGPAINQNVVALEHSAGTPENAYLPPPFCGPEPPTVSSRVKLADPSSGIVLECKTKDPKINIVWIFPAVKAVARLDE